jgi:hypothetical protein
MNMSQNTQFNKPGQPVNEQNSPENSEEEHGEIITPRKDQFRFGSMQQSAVNYKNFMGSRIYVSVTGDNPSRKKLPFLRPEGERIPIWSIIGKFIGQDLSKISLPVILSEPLSTLQKCADGMNIREKILARAA